MCDKMAISAYILKIVEKDPFLRLQMRANEMFPNQITTGWLIAGTCLLWKTLSGHSFRAKKNLQTNVLLISNYV